MFGIKNGGSDILEIYCLKVSDDSQFWTWTLILESLLTRHTLIAWRHLYRNKHVPVWLDSDANADVIRKQWFSQRKHFFREDAINIVISFAGWV